MRSFHCLGLMSGSSLDGLDVAHCRFTMHGKRLISWELCEAQTLPFPAEWQQRLRSLPSATALEFAAAHAAFGRLQGELVNDFLKKNGIEAASLDFIAAHGHTVFHDPAAGFTSQIGDGAALAAVTGCTVVCDFRTMDVAHGGQGAPLAAFADKMLFAGYDFYLNIGGIANLTCNANGRYVAFDTGGANQALDALAGQLGLPFDKDGNLARSGKLESGLLDELNRPGYFSQPYPKTLSNQWVQENLVQPCLRSGISMKDKLHTATQHVALQIAHSIGQIIENEDFRKKSYRLFATGGGAFNVFLMECLREELAPVAEVELVVPPLGVVKFKEALLMGLLGLMRMEGVANVLATATGASGDTVGGGVYFGKIIK